VGLPSFCSPVTSIFPKGREAVERIIMKKILGPFIVILTAGLAILFADPGPGKLLVILGIAVSLGGLLAMVKLLKFFWYL